MSLIRLSILMILVTMKSHSQPMDSIPENAKNRLKEILPGFSAYGFNLHGMSVNENILLANKTAIIVKYSDELNYLIAVYDFDPENPSLDKLKDAFEKVKVVIIRHSLESTNLSAPYHKIPHWVKNFKNIECLILDNVDLQNATILEELRLKFLGIQSAEVNDTHKLIQVIGKIESLEFLMYSSNFSTKDIDELREKLPNLTTFQPSNRR